MQAEIDLLDTPLPIRILGVNDIGLESGNSSIIADRELPWLQPAEGQEVWTLWQVEYRDVVILDPGNEYVATFNLTTHDLSDPGNYAALMSLLLDAAGEDAPAHDEGNAP